MAGLRDPERDCQICGQPCKRVERTCARCRKRRQRLRDEVRKLEAEPRQIEKISAGEAAQIDLAPESVREASADLAAKLARLEVADAAARDASDGVEQAVAEDHSAAVKAAEADRPTPKAKGPAAREKATEAERNVAALVEVVNAAQHRLLAAVREGREQLADAATAELADLSRQSADHVERLEAALTRRGILRGLLGAMGDGSRLEGRAAEFHVNPARPRRRSDPLAPDDRRVLDDLRGRLGL